MYIYIYEVQGVCVSGLYKGISIWGMGCVFAGVGGIWDVCIWDVCISIYIYIYM